MIEFFIEVFKLFKDFKIALNKISITSVKLKSSLMEISPFRRICKHLVMLVKVYFSVPVSIDDF